MLKKVAASYAVLSTMTLMGMLLALYADLKIGDFLSGERLDDVVKQITLLFAFDIVVRESLRFSLLKEFASANTPEIRKEMFGSFSSSLILAGAAFSLLYSCVYLYAMKGISTPPFFITVLLFNLMFIGSGLQLIVNLSGKYFLYSIRIFLFPLSILCWLFPLNSISLEYSFMFFLVAYVALLVRSLRGVVKNFSLWSGFSVNLQRYFLPPLFPMTNYSFLQASRYLERALLSSVSIGSSYLVYLSFKIYSSLIALIGIPLSVMVSKSIVDSGVNGERCTKSKYIHTAMIVVFLWIIGICGILMIWKTGIIDILFPELPEQSIIKLLKYYLIAALIGSLNLPLQANIYRLGGHVFIMKIIVILSIIYMFTVFFGVAYVSENGFAEFIAISFMFYTLTEFGASLVLLRTLLKV